ncbi:hypothetical protein RU07_10490 [Agrobacterium tumefaciens]|uniref:Uncharacterized protein n=1 Tax=Agrobacterium tumefaciens TaxID=358 RepID=A0A0D0KT14_AGRTU|nr:hypothetical protein RU07_10490 [Agrobacterium tumefaciens]
MVRGLSTVVVAAIAVMAHANLADADSFDFSSFQVRTFYQGKAKAPDFKGRDANLAPFGTRIKDAMKSGVTFAGEFSVVQFGCGTGCTTVVVANNRTGRLYSFPRGGEFNQGLTLEFKPSSNLMLVRWYTDSLWESCVLESLIFESGNWIAKDAFAGKGDEACAGDVLQSALKVRE